MSKFLAHDVQQRNYIEGSVMEGRLDWNHLDDLVRESKEFCRWANREYDRVVVCFSGGLDSTVLMHMCKDIDGIEEAVWISTPEIFDTAREYIYGVAERWDYDLDELERSWMDIEWLQEYPRFVFPDYQAKMERLEKHQRGGMAAWGGQNPDCGMRLTGRHEGDTLLGEWVSQRNGRRGNPMRRWRIPYVLAYLDRHDIPVTRQYLNHKPTHAAGIWHYRKQEDADGNQLEDDPESWWATRQFYINYGYTDGWKRLLEYYPDAPDEALAYASRADAEFPDLDDGYDRGADVSTPPDWN